MADTAARGPAGTSRYFDYDGPVHYLDYGGRRDGPLVVCVHGLGGSAISFDLIAALLAAECRIYAVDLIGHGRTPVLGRSATVGANRRVVDHFMREVVGEPAVVIGNSMGGLIALLQAAKRPDSVAGLVLIGPALPLTGLVLKDVRRAVEFAVLATPGLGSAVVSLWTRFASAERQVGRMLRLVALDPTKIPDEFRHAATALAEERRRFSGNHNALVQAARSVVFAITSPWYVAQLEGVRSPVLLIHGRHDRLVSIRQADEAAQKYDSWRFEVMDHVGHVPQLEDPALVTDTILEWMFTERPEVADQAEGAQLVEAVVDVREQRSRRA
ncbi:MAG: alpha/beta hydrolase [Candidatus Nanopelagicales bacterium]